MGIPISVYRLPGLVSVLAETVCVFQFNFTSGDSLTEPFDILYVSSHYRDEDTSIIAIAIVPDNQLEVWAAFEVLCNNAVRYLERRQDVFIIGGSKPLF